MAVAPVAGLAAVHVAHAELAVAVLGVAASVEGNFHWRNVTARSWYDPSTPRTVWKIAGEHYPAWYRPTFFVFER